MFKTKSIQTRVLFVSAVLIFGIVALITTVFYITERERLLEERVNVIELEVQRESAYIEREFSKIYENSQALSFVAEDMIDNIYTSERDHLLTISERLLDGNPNVVGVNIIFEDDILDPDSNFIGDPRFQSDGQFITYVSKQNDVLNIEYIENYQSYEMYSRAITLKDDFFTEPYYYNIQGKETYLSTVVFPIVQQGEFLGLIGVDFTADYIFEQMMLLDNTYERRDIIVSQNGTILLNTENFRDFGDHIATLHPDYQDDLADVNAVGIHSDLTASGEFEIVKTVDLASTGEHWYIYSDLDASLVFGELNTVAFQTVGIGVLTLLLGLTVLYFVNRRLTEPIKQLSSVVESYDAKTTSIDVFDIETRGLTEINVLRDNFRSTLLLVQENLRENKHNLELQSKQIAIQKTLESNESFQNLCDSIIEVLIKETNAMLGALYIKYDDNLRLEASSGLKKDAQKNIVIGDGLVGRVAKTQSPLFFTYPDDAETWIDFGLDTSKPPHIVIYPLIQNNEIIGVIQLVSINEFDALLNELLDESTFMINASIIKQQNIEKTQKLLKKSQQLTEELDQKQQDLEVQNEELESQQEELRVTNEELETQQEELRVTNEELQTNMEQVEKMNKELEQTRKELEDRTVEAERSNKYKSDFLANMSHELRTPLNSILILSNLISERHVSETKMKEYAETIHSSGSDLLELINGILDLSKVEAGKEKVNIKKVNLDHLVKELTQRYHPLADKKNIDFVVNKPNTINDLNTDPTKLKLIITNLLANAIKFTEKGSVTLNMKDEDDNLIFEVIDSGIGIDADQLDSIFEEFHQVESDSKRSFGGTGLGLSICKQYAKLLHGRVTVESTVNEGSTFRLILPKRALKDIKQKPKTIEEKEALTRSNEEAIIADDRHLIQVGDPSILIIDDNTDFLKSMRDFFRNQDINVIVSETGENGLYLADYYIPSIILVDEQLPKMNGQKVIEKLKSNPRITNCTFYIMSGKANLKDIEGAPFIKKPLSDKHLNSIATELKSMPKRIARILLIEDNKTHQQAVVEYLSNQKTSIEYNIDTVATKSEALTFLKQTQYALLVVDLSIGDTNEFDLIKEIRDKKAYKSIPIIVYTGKEFDSEEEAELSELVQDIIIKGEQSPRRLMHDIELFMSQKDEYTLVTDKSLFKDKKILVVDDDIRNIFALTGLLEAYDIKVVYNTAGKDAIERVKKESDIDLVLMDIMMPEMNGYETMEHIREKEKITDLPIIALTAKSMRGDREKCISAGANEYLSKPLNKDKLLSVLRVWLP